MVVQQFGAQRFGESVDGVFGAAVGRLQRDGAHPQRGSDLHDGARTARLHAREGGHRPVDKAQVADFGDATKLVRADLAKRCEHRRERIVDPDIDRPEGLLGLGCSGVDLGVVGDVGRNHQCVAAGGLHLRSRRRQTGFTARQQCDAISAFAERACGRAADTGAGPGDHYRAGRCCGHQDSLRAWVSWVSTPPPGC